VRVKTPRPLPDSLADGAFFGRSEAAEERVDANRLRARDIARPYRGVQATRAPTDLRERCRAYAVRMRPADVFSHVTAAALHGLPLPPGLQNRRALDVAAVHPAGAPQLKGVIGHRLRTAPPGTEIEGLPVCDAFEAWCQLAGIVELPDLVAVLDHLLQESEDPAGVLEAAKQAIERPRRYRTAVLRAALSLARPGSRSPQESRLRVILVLGGVPEPRLNFEVTDRNGRVLGHGDLVWPEARLIAEYEGDQHRTDEDQWNYDIRRYDDFAAAGWTVVRVPKESMRKRNRAALITRFARALGLQ
jgi:hypothetical protein